MTQTHTNIHKLHPTIAAWLLQSDYDDYKKDLPQDKILMTATSLLKPIRQTAILDRIDEFPNPDVTEMPDVIDRIAAKFGTAVHDSIERTWTNNKYKYALSQIGTTDEFMEKILVNPEEEDLFPGCVPLYFEQRSQKIIGDYVISGKFDIVSNGRLIDIKTTSTYGFMTDSNAQNYIIQGSIYKWLNPDIITDNFIKIVYVFTDWSKMFVKEGSNYPEAKIQEVEYLLMSPTETERWIRDRLAAIEKATSGHYDEIPKCTEEELWRTDEKFQYYAKESTAEAGGKATKNFDNAQGAEYYLKITKKGQGVVIHRPSVVKRCDWCPVRHACSQYKELVANGDIPPKT